LCNLRFKITGRSFLKLLDLDHDSNWVIMTITVMQPLIAPARYPRESGDKQRF